MTYVDTLTIEYLSNEDRVSSYDPLNAGYEWFLTHFPHTRCYERPSPLFQGEPSTHLEDYAVRFLNDAELHSKHRPIIEYERELQSKTGPQGGKIPWSEAADYFKAYYRIPRKVRFGKVAEVGKRAFLRMLRARLRKVAPPSQLRWLFYKDTAFGAPLGGDKLNEYGHKQGADYYVHPQVIWPNIRYMRAKIRAIFCASAWDCDAIGPDLTNVRNWLKQEFPHLFGAWHDPRLYTQRDIAQGIWRNRMFLETDFKAMDTHFTWAIVREIVLPVYQLLLAPADYLHFAAFVEEAFKQPLLCGNQLWTGEHSLFSGLPFTNDFETLYAMIIYLGAHLLSGEELDTFGFRYKGIGDDVVYYGEDSVVRSVRDLVSDEFDQNGVILHRDKTRMQRGECRFCRSVYYPGCRRDVNSEGYPIIIPAYPLILTVNNCLQPEHTADCRTRELLSCFARLDGGAGHYHFTNVVTWLLSKIPASVRRPLTADDEREFEQLQLKDWWYELYGTTYSLGDSPSAKIYRSLCH